MRFLSLDKSKGSQPWGLWVMGILCCVWVICQPIMAIRTEETITSVIMEAKAVSIVVRFNSEREVME